jgi:thiol-disulfide isomerase/thioredoxin
MAQSISWTTLLLALSMPRAAETAEARVLPEPRKTVEEILPDSLGVKAPAITSPAWINSKPLRAEDLRGKVVLVEFWTFGCGNCQATAPAMRRLYRDYQRSDVVMIGVHTPEFDYEKQIPNVRDAVKKQGIQFPVAIDNSYRIWNDFDNRYWPTIYVIDRCGVIRYAHIGELHAGTDEWRELTRRVDGLLREKA